MQCIWCDATIFSVNLAFSPEKTRSLILSLSNCKSTKQWSIFSVTLLKLEFDFSLYKSKMLVLFIYLFIYISVLLLRRLPRAPRKRNAVLVLGLFTLGAAFHIIIISKTMDLRSSCVVLWCSCKTKPKRQFYEQACLRLNNYIVFGSVIAVFLWNNFCHYYD